MANNIYTQAVHDVESRHQLVLQLHSTKRNERPLLTV